MELILLFSLVGLALVDSTSIGTLVIPIWFLLAGRTLTTRKFFIYVGTVAAFYFLVGLFILSGLSAFLENSQGLLSTKPVLYIQAAIGIGLFIFSFKFGSKRKKEGTGRINRWHSQITSGSLSTRAVVMLALAATALELATMVPYLAAIGLLMTSDLAWAEQILLLGGYVIVMVLPALVLFGIHAIVYEKIRPFLEKVSAWTLKNTSESLGWIIGIAGFLVARDAIIRLL